MRLKPKRSSLHLVHRLGRLEHPIGGLERVLDAELVEPVGAIGEVDRLRVERHAVDIAVGVHRPFPGQRGQLVVGLGVLLLPLLDHVGEVLDHAALRQLGHVARLDLHDVGRGARADRQDELRVDVLEADHLELDVDVGVVFLELGELVLGDEVLPAEPDLDAPILGHGRSGGDCTNGHAAEKSGAEEAPRQLGRVSHVACSLIVLAIAEIRDRNDVAAPAIRFRSGVLRSQSSQSAAARVERRKIAGSSIARIFESSRAGLHRGGPLIAPSQT